jgi:hypothetical protein
MCAQNGDISTAKALLQHGAHVDSKVSNIWRLLTHHIHLPVTLGLP